MKNLLGFKILSLLVVLLVIGTTSAAVVDATSGIAPQKVQEGDDARFVGTFNNFAKRNYFVQSLNVTFLEDLGSGATRDPLRINFTKTYEDGRKLVPSNNTFTDSLDVKMDPDVIEPGSYEVSIYFMYSESENEVSSNWNATYALINSSINIIGVVNVTQVIQTIFYVISGAFIIVLALIVRSRLKR